MKELKYPIGKFNKPDFISEEIIKEWIKEIHGFHHLIKSEVEHLSDTELNLNYRPGGWSIRQVIHHCADSHMNAFIRHKLTITENKPVIKPYQEKLFAGLADMSAPVSASLSILAGLCERWFVLLQSLSENDYSKTYIHPEYNHEFSLRESIGLYAWHGNHHLAHIKQAIKFRGNFEL